MDAQHGNEGLKAQWHELFKVENKNYSLALYADESFLECWARAEIYSDVSQTDTFDAGVSDNIGMEIDMLQSEADTASATLSVQPVLKPHKLISILKTLGIRANIDFATLYEFCADISSGIDPEPVILARGIAPQKGADGWLDLKVKISGSGIDLHENKHGYIDHKNLNNFTDILPGQKLAIIRSAHEGTPGISIQGLPIAADSGEPYPLTIGEGVTLKYNNRVAFATKSGKAVYEQHTLKIVDHVKINGDVDLSVGDIDFNGVVEISGDVPDDFDVKASKELYIKGAVGACQIESGGDMEINSMAGKEIGTIICHGTLKARFLNQVNVYCYGDVIVNSEIRHCRIKSTGSIIVEHGSIIGGSCVAFSGVEVQNIGAVCTVETMVSSGIYFPDEDRFTYLHKRRKQIEQQLKSINEATEPLQRLIQNKPSLAATARKRLKILKEQLIKLRRDKIRTKAELRTSRLQHPPGRNPKINIHRKLYEGVTLRLGETRSHLRQELQGPISVIENITNGEFHYTNLSDLAVPAAELSQQLALKEQGDCVNDKLVRATTSEP